MRSNVRTTIATYCLLSLAGGVSFMLPEGVDVRPPPEPIPLLRTKAPEPPMEPLTDEDEGIVSDPGSADAR